MSCQKMPAVSPGDGLNRRKFLRVMLWAGLISCSSKATFAAVNNLSSEVKSLSLYNPRTKERFNGIYWRNGEYIAEALDKVNYIMRDTRTDAVKKIDTDLLDLIYKVSLKLKTDGPFHVLSGYRSRKTNSLLLKNYKNTAKNSYHFKGQAVDIRLPGQRASTVRRAVFELREGGIGYYPRQGFVHVDVGPIRYWRG